MCWSVDDVLFELVVVGIVGVDYCYVIGWQCGIDCVFGYCYFEQVVYLFQVGGGDVVDQCIVWVGDIGQVGNVVWFVGVYFVDGVVGVFWGIDYCQWQVDFVVVVVWVGVDYFVCVLGYLLQD